MTNIQTIAQRELNQYIEQQAQEIAPEAINFLDIDGFYNFEAQVNSKVIAHISINTSRTYSYWIVEVNGIEVYQCDTFSQATDFVKAAYKNGTLQLHREKASLSTREERATTIEVVQQQDNEYLVHNRDNNHYYIVRPEHPEAQLRCECADCYFRGVKCKHQIAVNNFICHSRQSLAA
jgi:hypothetical protein